MQTYEELVAARPTLTDEQIDQLIEYNDGYAAYSDAGRYHETALGLRELRGLRAVMRGRAAEAAADTGAGVRRFAVQVKQWLVDEGCAPSETRCGACGTQSEDHADDCLWDQAEKIIAGTQEPQPVGALTDGLSAWQANRDRLRSDQREADRLLGQRVRSIVAKEAHLEIEEFTGGFEARNCNHTAMRFSTIDEAVAALDGDRARTRGEGTVAE